MKNGGFNLYDADQVPKLREKLLSLNEGRIAICITSIPHKFPPAPYEASLIINDMLAKNGTRDSKTAGRQLKISAINILSVQEIQSTQIPGTATFLNR